MSNFNIKSTVISDTVRVSSAAIFYEEWFGNYYQYETWIFRKDHLKSKMVIHGTSSQPSEKLKLEAEKIHEYMVKNLTT